MEEKRNKHENEGIKDAAFKQLIRLLDELKNGIEILYYLMDSGKGKSFVTALISADGIDLTAEIIEQKRETDLLFEIDHENNLYAILCQSTEVDGGYYFIKRLVESVQKKGGKNVYCSEVNVKNTDHPIQEIAFRLLNMYSRVKAQKSDGEISYYALN
jgi:hypothetical protein